ncbi:XPG/RAD2 endonuclease [Penicillium chrysogenum]|uniref:XPG/RAD2 endonuclease n=1 Tax=Penicillium chrysogenum TaxID=5076 RepID=A0ABQ8WMQ2_PENCH|nr:XPG/RAD2 endonuclease [Penicillium chrysogenum]KAJ5252085.1 XPG/RAD2 endonuclease [Penicillium chrysogenum]KAJ5270989.1 XPG/RAD2 endonuclease [Penicillium chrysogenum]
MGIKGLHGLLKSIQKPCHIKNFNGQTLGVDAYGWLHRGTVACSVDLVLDNPTRKHIDFVLNRVRMLLFFGVKPYLVFDGDNLPSKAGTEQDRYRRRQESKSLGLDLQRKGRMPEAYQEFQKAVDVTPYMARQLIEELKQMNVQYVVAPYEADAQLVYLEQQGDIQGIISEDSDLLVFGAKRLISKLDQHGECIEINRANFTACREVSLVGFSDPDFRNMCILSGCDYLANIPKLGLKTAYRIIRKHRNVEKALRMLQFEGNFRVPADYLTNFRQAELTFLYQRVFCRKAGKLVTLTPPDKDINLATLPFIGADMEPEIAIGVSRGDLDPTTKEPIALKPLFANRWTLGINRRQTLGTSSELKPKKSINSFFTPKRTPLAELDPNSLTPSPSQQRLLERNANNSWQANTAPFRSNSVRSTPLRAFSDQGLSPMVRSVERSSFLAQSARPSSLQSTKRQRLCSETEGDSLPACSPARSRFFAPTSDQTSPSGQKLSRSKRSRKSVIGVFSDEIAEDIMSSIPDPSTTPGSAESKPETSLEVSGKLSEVETPSKPTSNKVLVTEDLEVSQNNPRDTTPNSPGFSQALDYHVDRQNSNVLSRFTFQAGQKPETTAASSIMTKIPAIQTSHRPSTPSTLRSPAAIARSNVFQRRLTPLQRMGQSALSRSNSINIPTKLRNAEPAEPRTEASSPVVHKGSSFAGTQGSEDLIVPDSEDEEDEDEPSTRPSTTLDLKRFSFGAN